eukprot:scaffold7040_cov256-Pinguiococcus_pyrenoidosus.AAC.12
MGLQCTSSSLPLSTRYGEAVGRVRGETCGREGETGGLSLSTGELGAESASFKGCGAVLNGNRKGKTKKRIWLDSAATGLCPDQPEVQTGLQFRKGN